MSAFRSKSLNDVSADELQTIRQLRYEELQRIRSQLQEQDQQWQDVSVLMVSCSVAFPEPPTNITLLSKSNELIKAVLALNYVLVTLHDIYIYYDFTSCFSVATLGFDCTTLDPIQHHLCIDMLPVSAQLLFHAVLQ